MDDLCRGHPQMAFVIGFSVFLFIGGVAIRIRWENLVAFIVGPAGLLLLFLAADNALTPSAGDLPDVQATEVPVSDPLHWSAFILVLVIPAFLIAVLSFGRPYFKLALTWLDARVFTPFDETIVSGASTQESDQIQLYFETAAKLSALMANADGHAGTAEHAAFRESFDFGALREPRLAAAYAAQLKFPQSLQMVLRPYVFRFGLGNPLSETLVYGMARVALADGVVHPAERKVLIEICEHLCMAGETANRIFASVGIAPEESWSSRSRDRTRQHQRRPDYTSSLSDRERHLLVLGLKPGATMDDVKSARRRLAKKYHPDRLVAKGLPQSELEKAAAMMVKVNTACDWLEANGV